MLSQGKILEAEGTIAHSLGKGLEFSEMIYMGTGKEEGGTWEIPL